MIDRLQQLGEQHPALTALVCTAVAWGSLFVTLVLWHIAVKIRRKA